MWPLAARVWKVVHLIVCGCLENSINPQDKFLKGATVSIYFYSSTKITFCNSYRVSRRYREPSCWDDFLMLQIKVWHIYKSFINQIKTADCSKGCWVPLKILKAHVWEKYHWKVLIIQLWCQRKIHRLQLDRVASVLAEASGCIDAWAGLLLTSLANVSHPFSLNVNF